MLNTVIGSFVHITQAHFLEFDDIILNLNTDTKRFEVIGKVAQVSMSGNQISLWYLDLIQGEYRHAYYALESEIYIIKMGN